MAPSQPETEFFVNYQQLPSHDQSYVAIFPDETIIAASEITTRLISIEEIMMETQGRLDSGA
jgi:hypothetical protein